MISQAEPVDPSTVSDQVERVMSRPEFSYDKSLLDRFGEWLSDQLDGLFGEQTVTGAPGTFGGGVGSLVAWLIIVLALAAVVAAAVYVIRHRVSRVADDDESATTTEIEHRRSAREWRSDADEHESAGEWKLALRARYRELVRTLVDRGQVPDIAGRTTGELRVDLARTTPTASDAFDTASLLFELAWYADVPTGAEQNAELRGAATDVLAAPVERRGDDDSAPLSAGSVEVGR